ncbi:MAG: hypothetical protein IT427_13245 [Pirellulales bacterium]|nr:hypothetical protein [Pirellulales bacterium]
MDVRIVAKQADFLLLVALMACSTQAAENTVFKELRDKGVPLTNGESPTLPEPALADGLSAEEQQAAIAKVVVPGKIKLGFMGGSKTDPFQYRLTDIRKANSDPKASIGRHVDLYFVAQGKLSTVASEKFTKQQVNKEDQDPKRGKAEFYSEDELTQRGLKVVNDKDRKARYAHFVMPDLFGMVEVSGSGYGMQTTEKESVLVAFKLDPKFANDPKYPNQWRSLSRNDAGGVVRGSAEPYEGAGGYMKVTELKDQKMPRVFIEYHFIFDEPYGWFNGAATLSSKLPTKYEEDVRQFRVDLKEFEKKNVDPTPAQVKQ